MSSAVLQRTKGRFYCFPALPLGWVIYCTDSYEVHIEFWWRKQCASWRQWDGDSHYQSEWTPGKCETEDILLGSVVLVRKNFSYCVSKVRYSISTCPNWSHSSRPHSPWGSVKSTKSEFHCTVLPLVEQLFSLINWLLSSFYVFVTYISHSTYHRGSWWERLCSCLQWANCALLVACLYWFLPLDLQLLKSSDGSYPLPCAQQSVWLYKTFSKCLWIYWFCFCFWHTELKIHGYCSI